MKIFSSRLKYVNCKIWDTQNQNFGYPEISDKKRKISHLSDMPSFGVALSGGGTRAASAALGQLRGLHQIGLLRKVRYLSAVSGGAWTAAPFTYLPPDFSDKTFLGAYIPPENMSQGHLTNLDRNSMAARIANSIIIDDFIKNAFRFAGDETYSRAIGEIFLNSFGLDSLSGFFTQDRASREAILEYNSDMEKDDFYLTRSRRPFLIVGSTLMRLDNEADALKKFHFESTPLYAGCHHYSANAGSGKRPLGGGYIEPHGMDSDEPELVPSNKNIVKVRLGAKRHRYTLSDVIGTSGAAPSETLVKAGLDWVGFPEFKHWPVKNPHETNAKEYEFGDGGHLENLGLMPLLKRKVEKILVFINTKHPLEGPEQGQINGSLRPLFGLDFPINKVFEKNKYRHLYDGLKQAKDAGKSVVYRDTYRVIQNRHYGVPGNWSTEIVWFYNENVEEWKNQLKPDIQDLLFQGSLGNFPHYETFFQNFPRIIDLSAKQTSMLAHLSSYCVVANKDVLVNLVS